MSRKFVNVEDAETMLVEKLLGSAERNVREMFMVNRVKLSALDQPKQMGKFDSHDSLRLEQQLKTLYKAVQVGNMGQDIVGDDQVSATLLCCQFSSCTSTEESRDCRNASDPCNVGNILRRLHAKDGNTIRQKVLQQVAVVAANLHDQAMLIQMKTLSGMFSVFPRMTERFFAETAIGPAGHSKISGRGKWDW